MRTEALMFHVICLSQWVTWNPQQGGWQRVWPGLALPQQGQEPTPSTEDLSHSGGRALQGIPLLTPRHKCGVHRSPLFPTDEHVLLWKDHTEKSGSLCCFQIWPAMAV